jgi:CrcB protein
MRGNREAAGVNTYLLVALGGATGSVARYWLALFVARFAGHAFPWGTVMINILGSFIIGWFSELTAAYGRYPAPDATRALVMAGLCGGFTTFSAFSLQTIDLLRAGQMTRALVNVGASVVLCLCATALGFKLAQA